MCHNILEFSRKLFFCHIFCLNSWKFSIPSFHLSGIMFLRILYFSSVSSLLLLDDHRRDSQVTRLLLKVIWKFIYRSYHFHSYWWILPIFLLLDCTNSLSFLKYPCFLTILSILLYWCLRISWICWFYWHFKSPSPWNSENIWHLFVSILPKVFSWINSIFCRQGKLIPPIHLTIHNFPQFLENAMLISLFFTSLVRLVNNPIQFIYHFLTNFYNSIFYLTILEYVYAINGF